MDFSAKRLALLAGVGSPEDRHDIVQEQVQQLNESIEARETNDSEEQVRKAVRRTIQKMIAEGNLSLEEAHHDDVEEVTGGSARVMEQEGDDEAAKRAAARAAVEASPQMKAIKKALADLQDNPPAVGGKKGQPEVDEEEARKMVRNHPIMKAIRGALEDVNEGEVTEEMDDEDLGEADHHHMSRPMNEEDMEEVSLYEMEDGSMHMEMGGVRYHLQELEEVEIPDGATDAVVGDGGEIEFSQKMDAAE
tara:strand:- start:134 stop:880 length:747 start_codon:yes stop_codon:yes gene_type:complete